MEIKVIVFVLINDLPGHFVDQIKIQYIEYIINLKFKILPTQWINDRK